jgi:hypothetical protein
MSFRTVVELNHDYCPREEEMLAWAEKIVNYLRSGDPGLLPVGIRFMAVRHHSAPEFVLRDAKGEASDE